MGDMEFKFKCYLAVGMIVLFLVFYAFDCAKRIIDKLRSKK